MLYINDEDAIVQIDMRSITTDGSEPISEHGDLVDEGLPHLRYTTAMPFHVLYPVPHDALGAVWRRRVVPSLAHAIEFAKGKREDAAKLEVEEPAIFFLGLPIVGWHS